MIILNEALLEKQGITEEGEALIRQLHIAKNRVFEEIEQTDSPVLLEELVDIVTSLEFSLQRAWGFPQSTAFHRFWTMPKCTCPKMDNEDRYGTKQFVIAARCPLHGNKTGFKSFMESQ